MTMTTTSKNREEKQPLSPLSKGDRLTGAAIKLVRNIPGVKESVLKGVAFITRHETVYLQAKLEKAEKGPTMNWMLVVSS